MKCGSSLFFSTADCMAERTEKETWLTWAAVLIRDKHQTGCMKDLWLTFWLLVQTWRQLWRVLEMSDIVLLITDIRHPVRAFCYSVDNWQLLLARSQCDKTICLPWQTSNSF